MKMKKIGVTTKDSSRIWSNGLTQNAYFLIILLKKAGYDVDPVSEREEENGKKLENLEIKKISYENIKKYDIILEVCYSLTDNLFNFAKNKGIKIVTINYGNLLMLMQEDLILSPGSTPAINRAGVTSWISPHFEFQKGFIESTCKNNVTICPYIWDSKIFDAHCKSLEINPFYSGPNNLHKIGILESNINIIKTCIFPLLSLEKLERKEINPIKEILLFNAIKIKDNKKFVEVIDNFEIFNKKKLSAEGRIPLPQLFAKNHIGMVLSHHFYNDLNYLVLESLYTGNPVIHNSYFCKDAGYYYNTFDAEECGKQIINAFDNHDKNIGLYKQAARDVLFKYSINNKENIDGYKKLIESL